MPSGQKVFFINMAITAILLMIATGIMGYYFNTEDINWKYFSAYILAAGWFAFVFYGTWIGIVNIMNEKELVVKTSRMNSIANDLSNEINKKTFFQKVE